MSAPERVWVNGREAGAVSALDRGLQYGDGLFETLACVDGRLRLLGVHLERLSAGCARLGIAIPDIGALRRELEAAASGAPRAVVKLIVTRGAARARGYAPAGAEEASRIVVRYPWPEADRTLGDTGVRVRTAALRLGENPALAGLKHCNRLEQVLARREWSDPTIAEALLYGSSGALVSGTMSNVFAVRGAALYTPRLDRCGVAGIMRRTVLELAARLGILCTEAHLAPEEVAGFEELFLTNALIGIHPVRELDGRALTAGPTTRRLQAGLSALLAEAADA
jgi:4-amino-4-deoxychorismate lyase